MKLHELELSTKDPSASKRGPMNRDSLPPLLRGIGSTMILVATIVAIVAARRDIASAEAQREAAHRRAAPQYQGAAGLGALAGQIQELRSDLEAPSLAEEVFDSPWVEMLGIVGTAFIATSFYTEAIMKMRPQSNNEDPKPWPSGNSAAET